MLFIFFIFLLGTVCRTILFGDIKKNCWNKGVGGNEKRNGLGSLGHLYKDRENESRNKQLDFVPSGKLTPEQFTQGGISRD